MCIRDSERIADAPFDAVAGVDRTLRGDLLGRVLAKEAALACIGALGVLADHDELMVLADERSLIDVEVEIEAHLEQEATLDHARGHVGGADRADIDGIEAAPLVDDVVGEDHAVLQVTLAAQVVVDGVEDDAGSGDDLETFGDDVGPDAVATNNSHSMCHECSLACRTEQRNEKPPTEVDGRTRTPVGVRYEIEMIGCIIMVRSLTASHRDAQSHNLRRGGREGRHGR